MLFMLHKFKKKSILFQ